MLKIMSKKNTLFLLFLYLWPSILLSDVLNEENKDFTRNLDFSNINLRDSSESFYAFLTHDVIQCFKEIFYRESLKVQSQISSILFDMNEQLKKDVLADYEFVYQSVDEAIKYYQNQAEHDEHYIKILKDYKDKLELGEFVLIPDNKMRSCSGCNNSCERSFSQLKARCLDISQNASIFGNLGVGGNITAYSFNVCGPVLINNKSPLLGGSESLVDLRFTIQMPSSIGLTLAAIAPAVSPGAYTVTASISGAPTPSRLRGFGTTSISSLSVSSPVTNLASTGFSVLYNGSDSGQIATSGSVPTSDIWTASTILVNFSFNVVLSTSFSTSSVYHLPTVTMGLGNLGTTFVAGTSTIPGAYIANFNPYLTNLTYNGFTVNLPILIIGGSFSIASSITSIQNLINNFLSNIYIDFIIQGFAS
ncbi:hypothetical protein [Candidatus Babela massiliensis]|uniref:Uncharacterized protein n=1 Tax=Candidatus Babela massiliensis TaxID=673862 RepID=V6DGX8_9BACT|nr:hypothetical protein [Candidatus Babela massiliensis]CDK30852.1 hypothetical protein BABL1_gene_162 [Candidatus Babela massiliensis]